MIVTKTSWNVTLKHFKKHPVDNYVTNPCLVWVSFSWIMSELPFVFIHESKSPRPRKYLWYNYWMGVLHGNEQTARIFYELLCRWYNYMKNTEITLTFQIKSLRLEIIRNPCIIKTSFQAVFFANYIGGNDVTVIFF
jgi:hypothetical protein